MSRGKHRYRAAFPENLLIWALHVYRRFVPAKPRDPNKRAHPQGPHRARHVRSWES